MPMRELPKDASISHIILLRYGTTFSFTELSSGSLHTIFHGDVDYRQDLD